jgi:hypothetical protein
MSNFHFFGKVQAILGVRLEKIKIRQKELSANYQGALNFLISEKNLIDLYKKKL